MSLTALDPPSDLPPGPFLSVFVVHEILDAEKYAAYQRVSDYQALKPSQFGGSVIGFAKPPVNFAVAKTAHAVAVIKWPNFDAYRAWRGQSAYAQPGLAELHALAESESVYFIPLTQL